MYKRQQFAQMAVAFIWAGHAHKQWAASAAGANGMDKAGAGFRQGRGRGRFAL